MLRNRKQDPQEGNACICSLVLILEENTELLYCIAIRLPLLLKPKKTLSELPRYELLKKWNSHSFFLNSYQAITAVHIFPTLTLPWSPFHEAFPTSLPSVDQAFLLPCKVLTSQPFTKHDWRWPHFQLDYKLNNKNPYFSFSVTPPRSAPSTQPRRYLRNANTVS